MRVLLEVQGGPHSGRKIALMTGETVRLGRGQEADISFADDSFMSGVHCVVECNDNTCIIRDHDSTNGVAVNGSKAKALELKNGDEMVVGHTHFLVQVKQDEQAYKRRLVSVLRNDLQPLYAILDAARDKEILPLLRDSKAEHQSLYEGERAAELADVAPYLVRLPAESPLLTTLEAQAWGKSWGVCLTCDLQLKELKQHLRQFLTITALNGDKVFFRFYDPRVMRTFLPAKKEDDARQFFGPVRGYLVEDEKPGEFLHLRIKNGVLAQKKVELLQAPESR